MKDKEEFLFGLCSWFIIFLFPSFFLPILFFLFIISLFTQELNWIFEILLSPIVTVIEFFIKNKDNTTNTNNSKTTKKHNFTLQKKHYISHNENKIKSKNNNQIEIPPSWSPNEFIVGTYRITNKTNKKVYIGESINIQQRWAKHFYDLTKGEHHNYKLQNDFNKYGLSSFQPEVLKRIHYSTYIETKKILLEEEEKQIKHEKSLGKEVYNLENNEYKQNEIDFSYGITATQIKENNSKIGDKEEAQITPIPRRKKINNSLTNNVTRENKTTTKPINNKNSFFYYFDCLEKNQTPKITWEKLIKVADFNEELDSLIPITYAFLYNKTKNLNLNYSQLTDLSKNSNLKHQSHKDSKFGYNPLMAALSFNVKESLELDSVLLDYLIKNSNLLQFEHEEGYEPLYLKSKNDNFNYYEGDYGEGEIGTGRNALLIALANNKKQNLNLSKSQFLYLIKHSHLKHYDDFSENAFLYAIEYYSPQYLPFDDTVWDLLIDYSEVETKSYSWIIKNMLDPYFENKVVTYLNFNEKQWQMILHKLAISFKENGHDSEIFSLLENNLFKLGLSKKDLNILKTTQ